VIVDEVHCQSRICEVIDSLTRASSTGPSGSLLGLAPDDAGVQRGVTAWGGDDGDLVEVVPSAVRRPSPELFYRRSTAVGREAETDRAFDVGCDAHDVAWLIGVFEPVAVESWFIVMLSARPL
jgi:hypothetical protein